MNTTEVASWVKRNGIVALKADYSNEDPAIEKALLELGNTGTGLPFYVVYPKGGGAPITFDGILTKSRVLDYLAQGAGLAAPE